jgi:hypothetical protein
MKASASQQITNFFEANKTDLGFFKLPENLIHIGALLVVLLKIVRYFVNAEAKKAIDIIVLVINHHLSAQEAEQKQM